MKKYLQTFAFVFTALLCSLSDVNAQDFYVQKVNKTALIAKVKYRVDSKKSKKTDTLKITKPDSLRGLNRKLFNDSTNNLAKQFSFGRGDINGQLYATLISDRFISHRNKYLGEISFGSVVSNSSSKDSVTNAKATNINNFLNGGGNVFLKFEYLWPFGFKNGPDNFTFLDVTTFRPAANLPKLGQSQKFEDWNMELANELVISLMGHYKKLGVILKPKLALVGGSKTFRNSFYTSDSTKKEDFATPKIFGYFQMQCAVKIADKFLISISFNPRLTNGNLNSYFSNNKFSTIGIQALL